MPNQILFEYHPHLRKPKIIYLIYFKRKLSILFSMYIRVGEEWFESPEIDLKYQKLAEIVFLEYVRLWNSDYKQLINRPYVNGVNRRGKNYHWNTTSLWSRNMLPGGVKIFLKRHCESKSKSCKVTICQTFRIWMGRRIFS